MAEKGRQGLWLASGIAALSLALAQAPEGERVGEGCVEGFGWGGVGWLGTCLLETLGMILGACLPNELLVRGWGWRDLLAINQLLQGLGKAACWCVLTAGFGQEGLRGCFRWISDQGWEPACQKTLSVELRGEVPACRCIPSSELGSCLLMHPRLKSGGLLAGKDPQQGGGRGAGRGPAC